MDCPPCAHALRQRAVEGVPVAHCAACDGLLVQTRHTIRLVQALERQLEEDLDRRVSMMLEQRAASNAIG
jgi:Zn-finger nucleic acid-binding protein